MSEGNADVSRRAFLRAGAGATAVSTAAGTAAAQETDGGGGGGGGEPEWPSYVDGSNEDTYQDARGQDEVTVEVGSNYFDATKLWVDQGTTVVWEFAAPGHNVKPNDQPEGGSLAGTEGGVNAPVEEGGTYEVTFETGGMYTYFCGPHETLGMKGAVAGGGPSRPTLPDSAKSIGVASAFAMAATLGLAFFFMKYGGDYGDFDNA